MNALHPKLLIKPVSRPERIEEIYQDMLVTEGMPAGTAFSVALPRGWVLEERQSVPTPGPVNPLVELASFRPATDGLFGSDVGAELVVWAVFLPREMHGRDWLRAWMTSQNYEPLDSREAHTLFGIMGDVLAMRRRDGITWLHRLTTIKDADLLFLLDGRAHFPPGEDRMDIQEVFLMAVIRFRLLQATKQLLAEGFDTVILKGSSSIRFKVSGLWRQRPGGDAPAGGASLIFDNLLDQTAVGTMIAVLGMTGESSQELEAVTLRKLNSLGITFTARTDPQYEDETLGRNVVVRSVAALRDGAALTVVSARIILGAIPASLILISPSGSEAFEVWSVNLRAFDIALDSMENI